jgi:hypothetical protein
MQGKQPGLPINAYFVQLNILNQTDKAMIIVQIEHEVLNFEGWKKAFESDPINRKKAGVSHYRIFQRVDNPNFVVIDLEFDDLTRAQNTVTALKNLWERVDGKIMVNPQVRMLNLVESADI